MLNPNQVLSGTYSQTNVGSDDVKGKQCTGTAASFLCHMFDRTVNCSADIDGIISWGTEHYRKVGATKDGFYRYLQLNEICKNPIVYKHCTYHLKIIKEYYGAVKQLNKDNENATVSLFEALHSAFNDSTDLLLIFGVKACSLKKKK